jgi:hypothetical protein
MFARPVLLSAAMFFGLFLGATPASAQPALAPLPAQSILKLLPAQLGLTPSPAQLQFGAVGIHYGNTPQQSVTFSNESPSPVSVMPATINGTDSSRFQIAYDGCANQTIWPGNSCNVEIRFQPGELGEKSANLALELVGEGMLEVPLSGSGSSGTISANPGSLGFSAIPYTRSDHEESQNETEQVNIGAQDFGVQVESVSITGPDASSFSVQYGNCDGNQLSVNNWCDAGIRFQPVSPDEKHAQLVIKSDAQNGTLVVPLEGNGLNGPKIELSSNEALLGNITVGSSAWHTFTVANSGDYPLFIQQSFTVSGTPQMFPLLSDTCTGQFLTPGASCVYTVGFQPTTVGEKDASVIFITNASPQINVLGINGVGVQPAVVPTTTSPAATPQVAQAAPAPAATPQLTQVAPKPKHDSVAQPGLLTFEQTSHLYSSTIGEETVDTGINAQCPAKVSVCQTESVITAHIPSHPSNSRSQSIARTTVLLGSQIAQLRGGESSMVHITLSNSAIALLKLHGHLRVNVETTIRAGGTIIAERARTVRLVASTIAPRSARVLPLR